MLMNSNSPEIEALCFELMNSGTRTLAITAPHSGCGVSSIAVALCEALVLAGHSTLLVDLNADSPALDYVLAEPELDDDQAFNAPSLMRPKASECVLTGTLFHASRQAAIRLRQPGFFAQQLQCWREQFDYVILDAGPVSSTDTHTLPAAQLIANCEAFVMTVLARETTETQVEEALRSLNASSAWFIGCVINDVLNPSLQRELLRELQRLPRFLGLIARFLTQKIRCSRFLSMEV